MITREELESEIDKHMRRVGTFHGSYETRVVTLTYPGMEAIVLDKARSEAEIFDYGTLAFKWGAPGYGTTQLAASMLLELVPETMVIRMYQRFKVEVLLLLQPQDFSLGTEEIWAWIDTCNRRDSTVTSEPYSIDPPAEGDKDD